MLDELIDRIGINHVALVVARKYLSCRAAIQGLSDLRLLVLGRRWGAADQNEPHLRRLGKCQRTLGRDAAGTARHEKDVAIGQFNRARGLELWSENDRRLFM